jgi:hypothetical protein
MTSVPLEQDPYAQWDAAYVLGSLSHAQRCEYESHLVTCGACRSAVAELSGVPPVLAMLSHDELPDDDLGARAAGLDVSGAPPPRLLEDLIAEIVRRRRYSRRLALTAAGLAATGLAAALLLVFGGLIVWRPAPDAPHGPAVAELAMVSVSPSELTATVTLTSRAWGTDIDMTCTYQGGAGDSDDPDGTAEQLVLVTVGRDGSRNELSSWVEHDGATALPTASTALHVDQIASVEVMSRQTKRILLRSEL